MRVPVLELQRKNALPTGLHLPGGYWLIPFNLITTEREPIQ